MTRAPSEGRLEERLKGLLPQDSFGRGEASLRLSQLMALAVATRGEEGLPTQVKAALRHWRAWLEERNGATGAAFFDQAAKHHGLADASVPAE